jgi:ribosome-binding factor A
MSRRTEKIASLIRNVVGEAISHRLNDPRISPMASVTRVKVTGDLQFADVWVSVMGGEGEQRATLTGLTHASGHIQSLLARALMTRHCPTLRFKLDDSIKKGFETLRLIDRTMAELDEKEQASPDEEGANGNQPGECV